MNDLVVNVHDIGGQVIKDNETYLLKDNASLKYLIVSSTKLYRGQQTNGHRHVGQEEVYFFVQGFGRMIVGDEDSKSFPVGPGSVVLIQDGQYHRVINDGDINMIFNCVFQGQRNH
jgi:oxalate decarboxylase/phosphoglucose isomerase-like protein (cupin superfamily)